MFYIATQTKWSYKAIMQMPMARLTAMLADMPRLVKKGDTTKQFNSDEELKAWLLNE